MYVKQHRYPDSCLNFQYDASFPIRGLYYDKKMGYLLKLDLFNSVQPGGCFFGRRRVMLKPSQHLKNRICPTLVFSTFPVKSIHSYKYNQLIPFAAWRGWVGVLLSWEARECGTYTQPCTSYGSLLPQWGIKLNSHTPTSSVLFLLCVGMFIQLDWMWSLRCGERRYAC